MYSIFGNPKMAPEPTSWRGAFSGGPIAPDQSRRPPPPDPNQFPQGPFPDGRPPMSNGFDYSNVPAWVRMQYAMQGGIPPAMLPYYAPWLFGQDVPNGWQPPPMGFPSLNYPTGPFGDQRGGEPPQGYFPGPRRFVGPFDSGGGFYSPPIPGIPGVRSGVTRFPSGPPMPWG